VTFKPRTLLVETFEHEIAIERPQQYHVTTLKWRFLTTTE
jgi:hypothetical protein